MKVVGDILGVFEVSRTCTIDSIIEQKHVQ